MEVQKSLYAVVGGDLEYIYQNHYRDPTKVETFGFYEDRDEAHNVWRAVSHKNVDNAHYRARIVKVY